MVAREHRTGANDLSLGLFEFIDTVYRQALTVSFLCREFDIGDPQMWDALSEKQFLAYFRLNVPEEGKAFLREKFSEQPRKLKDTQTMIQFAAMARYFHQAYGLGPSPEWTEREDLRAAGLYDIKPLIDRPISWALRDPQERASHFRSLAAARYAESKGAMDLLDKGDREGMARLLIEGFRQAHKPGALTP